MNKTRNGIANNKRLYIFTLIEKGVNTVPLLEAETGFPKRTIEKLLTTLMDLDMSVERVGSDRNGHYIVSSWGFVSKTYVQRNIETIKKEIYEK